MSYHVLAADDRGSTNSLVKLVNLIYRTSDEGCTSVGNSLASLSAERTPVSLYVHPVRRSIRNCKTQFLSYFCKKNVNFKGHILVHFELPVALPGDWDVGEVSIVKALVGSTKDELSTFSSRCISTKRVVRLAFQCGVNIVKNANIKECYGRC